MTRRLIGTGTTDAQGRCVIEYTGTGAGLVNLQAEYSNEKDTIQSDVVNVFDAIFYDKGITGAKNENWTNFNNRLTVVTDETGTTLTGYESSNGYYIARGDNPFTFTDYTAEFTVVGTIHSYLRWFHQNQANTNENVFVFNSGWFNQDENNVKITVNNGVATLNVNGRQRGTTTLTVTSPYEVAFRFANGAGNTIKYKDFKIY
jgi:hypothetical protein